MQRWPYKHIDHDFFFLLFFLPIDWSWLKLAVLFCSTWGREWSWFIFLASEKKSGVFFVFFFVCFLNTSWLVCSVLSPGMGISSFLWIHQHSDLLDLQITTPRCVTHLCSCSAPLFKKKSVNRPLWRIMTTENSVGEAQNTHVSRNCHSERHLGFKGRDKCEGMIIIPSKRRLLLNLGRCQIASFVRTSWLRFPPFPPHRAFCSWSKHHRFHSTPNGFFFSFWAIVRHLLLILPQDGGRMLFKMFGMSGFTTPDKDTLVLCCVQYCFESTSIIVSAPCVCVGGRGTFQRKNQKAGPVGPRFGETLCGPGQLRTFLAALASHISFSVSTIPELFWRSCHSKRTWCSLGHCHFVEDGRFASPTRPSFGPATTEARKKIYKIIPINKSERVSFSVHIKPELLLRWVGRCSKNFLWGFKDRSFSIQVWTWHSLKSILKPLIFIHLFFSFFCKRSQQFDPNVSSWSLGRTTNSKSCIFKHSSCSQQDVDQCKISMCWKASVSACVAIHYPTSSGSTLNKSHNPTLIHLSFCVVFIASHNF